MTRDSCLIGASINLSEIIIATLRNIVTRCVFRQKFEDDGESKIGGLPRRVTVLLAAFSLGDFFPSLRWIDILTGFIPCLKSTFGEIDVFLDQVVQEHMIMKGDHGLPNKNDFVGNLLELRKSGKLDFELTHKNVKALLSLSLSLSHEHPCAHTGIDKETHLHMLNTSIYSSKVKLMGVFKAFVNRKLKYIYIYIYTNFI